MKISMALLPAFLAFILGSTFPEDAQACNFKASFTYSNTVGCNFSTVNFTDNTDTVDNGIIAFYWDFGDGSGIDSVNYNPSHSFSTGTYLVKLKIVNNHG